MGRVAAKRGAPEPQPALLAVVEPPAAAKARAPARKSRALTVAQPVQAQPEADVPESLKGLIPAELAQFLDTNVAEGREQYQRSLDLFGEGTAIEDSKQDFLLKKGSQRIRSETSLTLLQRKLFNALLFVARPALAKEGMFSVPVDYLSWCVSHDRSDMKYLKESVRAMKKQVIEVENDNGQWFMTNLLADAGFDGKNLVYDLPALIRATFSAPKRYYYISMVVNARFRSKYALALYELLKEYEYRGETDVLTIEEYRQRMGVEKHEYPEFKRLSARTITGPLQELEEVSDFSATPVYTYRGRKILGVKFVIKPNPKNQYNDDAGERIRPEYWSMLKDDFGLNRTQLDEVTRAHPAARIEEVCDVLYFRYIARDKEISNGYRLLTKALQDTDDNYHLTNREKNELVLLKERQQKKSFEQEMQEAQTRALGRRMAEFADLWANWTDPEQREQWCMFLESIECQPLRTARLIKTPNAAPNLEHPAIMSAFMNFLLRTGKLGDD
jgi:hypothetical protein